MQKHMLTKNQSLLGFVGESLLEALRDSHSFTLAAVVFTVSASILVLICSQMNLEVSTLLLTFGEISILLPESIVSPDCPDIEKFHSIDLPYLWNFHNLLWFSLCSGFLALFSVATIACLLRPIRQKPEVEEYSSIITDTRGLS